MTQENKPRTVHAKRMLTLGTVMVSIAGSGAVAAPTDEARNQLRGITVHTADHIGILMAAGEGGGEGEAAEAEGEGADADAESDVESEGEGAEAEGEGEAAAVEGEGESEGGGALTDTVRLHRDLGFITGHLRAGMALYEQGDLAAARTHMGHPIEEKYDAVAEPLEALGMGGLRGDIEALAAAAEAAADAGEVRSLFDHVLEEVAEARTKTGAGPAAQMKALAELSRIAADEYGEAVEGGAVEDLHEYQDAWGFLRSVEAEAGRFAGSDDAKVAAAGQRILELVGGLDVAFGDLQGQGDMQIDPSLIWGAAARMELAALGAE